MLYSSRKSIALQEELTKVDDLLKMVEETNEIMKVVDDEENKDVAMWAVIFI